MSVKLNSRLCAICMPQPSKHQQQGVVLFFALIALVVMSLAAVALIRSVDSNSMIAANISFKQSTMLSADSGVEAAIRWIEGNAGLLDADSLTNGYYATSLLDAKPLVDGAADGKASINADSQGNSVSYVVQRMCQQAGIPKATTPQFCMSGPSVDLGCPGEYTNPKIPCDEWPTVFYRVTVKVVDKKNTLSYVQTFTY